MELLFWAFACWASWFPGTFLSMLAAGANALREVIEA